MATEHLMEEDRSARLLDAFRRQVDAQSDEPDVIDVTPFGSSEPQYLPGLGPRRRPYAIALAQHMFLTDQFTLDEFEQALEYALQC
jgi:hypothetical protein